MEGLARNTRIPWWGRTFWRHLEIRLEGATAGGCCCSHCLGRGHRWHWTFYSAQYRSFQCWKPSVIQLQHKRSWREETDSKWIFQRKAEKIFVRDPRVIQWLTVPVLQVWGSDVDFQGIPQLCCLEPWGTKFCALFSTQLFMYKNCHYGWELWCS